MLPARHSGVADLIVTRRRTSAWSGLAGEWPLFVVAWASRSSATFGGTTDRFRSLKNEMKKLTLRLAIAIFTFIIGVAAAGLWTIRHYSRNEVSPNESDCIPKYVAASSSANREGWGSVLDRFQEMRLDELPTCVDESYRLIWIPTFHSTVSVRIWRSGEKQFLVTKQLDGRGGGYGMGRLAFQDLRSLSDDEWNEFMRLLRQSGYWDLPTQDELLPPEDGAAWVIEGVRNGKLHLVNRRTPSSEFREASVYLVKLSGLKTEIEKY